MISVTIEAARSGAPKRGLGSMRGKARLDESFWEPLPDEELKLWESG